MPRRYLVALVDNINVQFRIIPLVDITFKSGYAILDLDKEEVTKDIIILFLQIAYWCKVLYFCKDLSWRFPKPEDVVPNWDIGVILHNILGSSSGFSPASIDLFKLLS